MSETISSSTETRDAALCAILDHHAALERELGGRVRSLLEAARRGGEAESTRQDLVGFLEEELMPHAGAEESTLYPAARREPSARLLVDAMTDEHRALATRLAALREQRDPVELAATAAEIGALFGVHLQKENELLLPVLVATGADLAALLRDAHHLLGHANRA